MKKKLIIGIDASRSNVRERTGTEYYSYEIIKELIKSKEADFRLYSKTPLGYLPKLDNVKNKVMKFPRLWSQIRLSIEMISNPPDVLFVPAHTIPILHPKKTVTTLHDLGFKHFPELYTPLERYYHDFSMGFAVRHATKIIAISHATKNDLIKIYKADPKKIEVIYHGFDRERYYPLESNEKIPDDIKTLRPYIFFIGRLEAKKNVKTLIKSYGLLRENSNIKHKLVLAGRPGYQYEEIKDEINRLPFEIRNDVVELGYVEDKKATYLTRCADIFAFPSFFEGFGMPILENMASGVPIVGSNTTSIPEIAGDCALLSEPKDEIALASNMRKLIEDKDFRDNLVKKGLKRAELFSWEKCARETLDVTAGLLADI